MHCPWDIYGGYISMRWTVSQVIQSIIPHPPGWQSLSTNYYGHMYAKIHACAVIRFEFCNNIRRPHWIGGTKGCTERLPGKRPLPGDTQTVRQQTVSHIMPETTCIYPHQMLATCLYHTWHSAHNRCICISVNWQTVSLTAIGMLTHASAYSMYTIQGYRFYWDIPHGNFHIAMYIR